jgi:hypothetical protein
VEVSLFSVALCVGINEALYRGPTQYSAASGPATGASTAMDYVDRVPRFATLLGHPDYGLLVWAPVFALASAGLWWLWRSRHDRLARALSGLHQIELTAGLCATVLGVQLAVAALLAPTADGPWFAGRHLLPALPLAAPLLALGLRRVPRLGVALALITLGISVWLYADVRWGGGSL